MGGRCIGAQRGILKYLSAATSRCDTHTIPEREGDPPTVGYSPSQSGIQKRIESKSNPNLKKELAGLVGDAFADAERPGGQAACGKAERKAAARNERSRGIDTVRRAVRKIHGRQMLGGHDDSAGQERLADSAGRMQSFRPSYTLESVQGRG